MTTVDELQNQVNQLQHNATQLRSTTEYEITQLNVKIKILEDASIENKNKEHREKTKWPLTEKKSFMSLTYQKYQGDGESYDAWKFQMDTFFGNFERFTAFLHWIES